MATFPLMAGRSGTGVALVLVLAMSALVAVGAFGPAQLSPRTRSLRSGAASRSRSSRSQRASGASCSCRRTSSRAPALPPRSRFGPLNVWSNAQAIEDYQKLLSGQAPTVYGDRPSCFVIGTGVASAEEAKLGRWLMALNPRGDDVAVDALGALPMTMVFDVPDGPDEELESFPIYM